MESMQIKKSVCEVEDGKRCRCKGVYVEKVEDGKYVDGKECKQKKQKIEGMQMEKNITRIQKEQWVEREVK